jgi:hypothetical protein
MVAYLEQFTCEDINILPVVQAFAFLHESLTAGPNMKHKHHFIYRFVIVTMSLRLSA